MNSISFKNLKLFKSPDSQSVKPKKSLPSLLKSKKKSIWQKFSQNPFLYLFLFVAALAYLTSYLPSRSLPADLIEGEIATSDIIAPEDLTIEDTETTEKRRNAAAAAVLPVYDFDPNVFLNTEEQIRGIFRSGREWLKQTQTAKRTEDLQQEVRDRFNFVVGIQDLRPLIRAKFDERIEEYLNSLLGKTLQNPIVASRNLFYRGEQEKGLTLIKDSSEINLKANDILDIKESKEILASDIDQLDLSSDEKSLLRSLAPYFLKENIKFNRISTENRRDMSRKSIETVFYTIKKGKVVLRKGDEVTKEALDLIRLINQNLGARPGWLTNFAGTFLLFGLIFITLWYYLKSLLKVREALRSFIMMGIIFILSILVYKLSIFLANTFSASTSISLLTHVKSYWYAFPFQLGVLILTFLTGNQRALLYTIINSLLVGHLFKGDFELMMYCFIGGLAAIYGIRYFGRQNRNSIFRAGFHLVAPINIFVIITVHLIHERLGPIDLFASELFMGIVGGLLSASFAFLFLPVFENAFRYLTQSKLLELTNSDLPIFRQMAIEAPGTYHHSLLVASLAEGAAEEIGLDPMLVKTSAYYHDIGKIKRPEYFIENKMRTQDLHQDLKPSMSTLVIVNHVKEGLELAKKLKLPRIIKDIIEQHHGNSLVRYFFQKAKEKYDPEMHKIGEENYRYPGPIPRTKEAGLILLCDSVEAASRSLKNPTMPTLKRMITEIFNSYLQDGQLDDCGFSVKELRTIAASVLSNLYTILHPRVEYPGFDFEMKKRRKAAKSKTPNDRNHKPTA